MKLDFRDKKLAGHVALPPSKSLVNRALILQALYPAIKIEADFSADDTRVLSQALAQKSGTIELEAAGTAARFATAFFASQPEADVLLTGSARLHERPIAPLVDALKSLGADIKYVGKEGFFPLQINGKSLSGGTVKLDSSLSSQFATALMLIAPKLPEGLHIVFVGKVASASYIRTTAALMQGFGFGVDFNESEVRIHPTINIENNLWQPEADWSAAAFWFAATQLASEADIMLAGLQQNSTQSDARLVQIFEELGIKHNYTNTGLHLAQRSAQMPGKLVINLKNNPDLAQTMACFCAARGIGVNLTGLSTLKNKETDRLAALVAELKKVGIVCVADEQSLSFESQTPQQPTVPFETYEDHRMAMSLAIFAFLFPIKINNPQVVSKSYPNFWGDVEAIMQ